ncbi:helix-turn-helix domain-containing protein [Nocardia puris]|uniref:helix-turn-helix domain-containing protein n=1 Tax=Nocardia puris TaxID=208602 RepID=UPI001E483BDC|nr:helix-turn-helix domain-containing protein [Nocardia puris]
MDPIVFDSDLGAGWDVAHAAVRESGVEIVGFRDRAREGMDARIVPGPMVAVVLDFGAHGVEVVRGSGSQATGGVVSAMAPGAVRVRSRRVECVEIRLSPVRAYSLFGTTVPGVVAADEVWGSSAQRLRERLAEATSWQRRFELAEAFVLSRCSFTADPEVAASWERIVAGRGQVRVAELTELCGWSRKRLWSRFTAQIGLTPKRAAMLVRFDRAVQALTSGAAIADVAARCGYVDQSHLHRDTLSFAGCTPKALTSREHSSKTRA